jgi:protein gp37
MRLKMADHSKIEWTEASWNPITGCTKISDGCKNCYAERMAIRLQSMGQESYKTGFEFAEHERLLNLPLQWKKPRKVFVCSMSDLFHDKVTEAFRLEIFDVMRRAHWHIFQVLTKRSENLVRFAETIDWPNNVWAGVTVESYKYISRMDDLKKVNAPIRFLSIEPLITEMPRMDLNNIHWVIVGGESGYGARHIEERWVEAIRDQCIEQQVPFFFKQWGGVDKKKKGRYLGDELWEQTPVIEQYQALLSI